jgi:hypothetical protein
LAADEQNVKAIALLTEAAQADKAEVFASPAQFNRNASEAISQVAGTWRFETSGGPGQPLRVERQDALAAGYGGGYGFRRAPDDRYTGQGSQSGGRIAGGGYGRGYGGGYGTSTNAPYGSALDRANQPPTRGGDSLAEKEGRAPAAALPAQEAAEPEAYRAAPLSATDSLEEVAAAEPSAALGLERARTETETLSQGSIGQAWVIRPLPSEGLVPPEQGVEYLFDQFTAPTAPPAPGQESQTRTPTPGARAQAEPQMALDLQAGQRDNQLAKSTAVAQTAGTAPQQVRMVFFFNVVPNHPLPAAPSAAQPSGAAEPLNESE